MYMIYQKKEMLYCIFNWNYKKRKRKRKEKKKYKGWLLYFYTINYLIDEFVLHFLFDIYQF
jgi:hypothetical protein